MINKNTHLAKNLFNEGGLKQAPTRDGFGEGLVLAGEDNYRVIVLCADLAESTRVDMFQEKFPERYIEIGVAEQNLATVASGLANYGKIPFITSYAAFSPGRNNEQIRSTISLNNVPVKIVGAHSGVSVGPDGATHQALEDIALMRVQPNMTVLVPCDAIEARKATISAAEHNGPVYLRLTREKTPVITTENAPFEIGKAQVVFESNKDRKQKVGFIGCGPLLYNTLIAAKKLEKEGVSVSVLNLSTIKPLDEKAIISFAKEFGKIVTVEEHQIAGGMGSAVAELLAKTYPTPIEFIGVNDKFGQSGTPDELIKHYGMDVDSIVKAGKRALER